MINTSPSIDYIQTVKSKGKTYRYYRRDGLRRAIKSAPGTKEFRDEVRAIEAEFVPSAVPLEHTLGAIIVRYKASHRWRSLKPATQGSYDRAFNVLAGLRDVPVVRLSRSAIIRIRDEAVLPKHGVWMANMTVTVLSIVFGYAFDVGLISSNPLQGRVRHVRAAAGGARPNRPWSIEERCVVLREAKPHVALVIALAMSTGMRKQDIFDAKLSSIVGDQISVRTSKRDRLLQIPVHPILRDALKSRPVSTAEEICVTQTGNKWTPDGFDSVWHQFKKGLEADRKIKAGLTIHGLRHTLATVLREHGFDDGSIADVLGQSGVAMARFYSREAGLPRKIRDEFLKLKIA